MSKQDRVPYEGDWVPGKRGTPPNPFPTDAELYKDQPANIGTHLRNAGESFLGSAGDVTDVGLNPAGALMKAAFGRWGAPGSTEAAEATDWLASFLPQGGQDWLKQYTRNPSQDPGSQVLGQGVEQGVDPMDLVGGGAALKTAKHIPDLVHLLKGWL
jgi:hypothetical protein